MSVDRRGLIEIAQECVVLVGDQFGEDLDWTIDSLAKLDEVSSRLLADGPLAKERFDLWWKLIGAYVGEVVIRTYDGAWIEHEQASGAYAVSVLGLTGFPFNTTARVLEGEEFKSLASFARSFPAISARSATTEQPSSKRDRQWPWRRKQQ